MQSLGLWQWIEKEDVGSTNDEALALSREVKSGNYVVTAKRQNNGRGRRGRSWVGYEGNLFMSFLQPVELSKIGQIVFVVSLSLFESLQELFPKIDMKLKWPNDVLVENNKISGILLEKGEGDYLVIGIGVNLVGAPKLEGVLYPATSLQDKGYHIDRLTLFKKYVEIYDKNCRLWQEQGFAPIREKWLQNVKGLGEEIEVHTDKETKLGIFRDVDENGVLLLERKNGLEKIYAGDIFYIDKKK